MEPGRFTRELTGMLHDIPRTKFVLWAEITVFAFLALFILSPADIHLVFCKISIPVLIFIMIVSCLMLLLSRSSLDLMGLLSGVLMLSGITVTVLQVEYIISLGRMELTIVFFIISAALAGVFGAYMLLHKVGKMSRGILFLIIWIFSLSVILYYPFSNLLFQGGGLGQGLYTSLHVGGILSLLSSILFIYNSRMEEEYVRWIDMGDMRRVLGDDGGAEKAYLRALKTGVNYHGIHTRLGDLLLDGKRHEEAFLHYNRALDYAYDRNYRQAAMAAWSIGQYRQAKGYMIKGLNIRASPQSWYFLGIICGSMNETDREREGYRLSLEMDDEFWPAMEGLAKLDLSEGPDLYKKALTTKGYHPSKRKLLMKVRSTGKFAPVYLHPGDLSIMEVEHIEVERDALLPLLERIMDDLDMNDTWTRGKVKGALKEFDALDTSTFMQRIERPEAIMVRNVIRAALDEDIERDKLEAISEPLYRDEAHYLLGIKALVDGKTEDALKYLSEVRSKQVRPRALAAKGAILYSKGGSHEAVMSLKTALAMGYNEPSVWEALKRISEEMGDPVQAAHYAMGALELTPSLLHNHDSSMVEMVRRVSHGDLDAVSPDIDIVTVHPLFAGAVRFLKGEYSAAHEIFAGVLKEEPDLGEGHLGVGISLLGMGKYPEALAVLRSARRLYDEDPFFLFYYGLALYNTGNTMDAYRAFQRVYRDRPGWETNNYYRSLCENRH